MVKLFQISLRKLMSIYSLRKLQNNQETTMLLYAKYKTKVFILECSTGVSRFLLASRICSKLLLA